jgi:hypothetical protein
MFGEDPVYYVAVGDVALQKLVAFAVTLRDAGEILLIGRARQRVDVGDEFRLIVLQHKPREIAPDKSAATGDEETHPQDVTTR